MLSVGPHVEDEIWKPFAVESVRSGIGTEPLLVTVTDRELLMRPTPVMANVIVAGWALTEAAAPPMPTREALAGSGKVVELADNVPLTTPFMDGMKITPTEQLAPDARLVPHVLAVRVNGA